MPRLRDPKHASDLVMRLKRVEGQVRGLQQMIERGEDCEPIAQQMSAARKALDRAFFQMVACAIEQAGAGGRAGADGRAVAQMLARFG